MQLLESVPRAYNAHNTAGEHAQKHSYDPHVVDRLRMEYMRPTPEPWDQADIIDLMFQGTKKGQFVSVAHISPIDSQQTVIAGALMRFDELDDNVFERVGRITDIVVAPDHRQKRLASFMLGVIWQRVDWGRNGPIYPTRLIVDTSQHDMPDWFSDKLQTVGFKESFKEGLALRLPGQWFDPPVEDSEYQDLLKRMPSAWSGIVQRYDDEDTDNNEIHAFQRGERVGLVHSTSNGIDYDSNDCMVIEYALQDSEGKTLKTDWYQNDRLAVVDLLNHPAVREA